MSLTKEDITIKEGLERFDVPARELAKKVVPKISNSIVEVLDHPNQYSIDLIGYDKEGNGVAYIEVEASHSWKTLHFPWRKLSYLEERKGRYLYEKRYFDLDMYFIMFNNDFTAFAITDRQTILNSPVESHSRTWKGMEKFRMIEKKDFDYFKVNDLL